MRNRAYYKVRFEGLNRVNIPITSVGYSELLLIKYLTIWAFYMGYIISSSTSLKIFPT